MAKKVIVWASEDGRQFDSETEALRADVEYMKTKIEQLEKCVKDWEQRAERQRRISSEPISSYGSSGGGGHD